MGYKRLVIFFGGMLFLFAVVQLRLFGLITNQNYNATAQNQTHYIVELPIQRANFYDRTFTQLTGTETVCYALASAGAEGYAKLYPYVSEEYKAELYNKAEGDTPYIIEVTAQPEDFESFLIAKRYSPVPMAVHTIGYLNADGAGVTGLERALNEFLIENGIKTTVRCATDALGRIANGTTPEASQSGSAGAGVVLTLDSALQRGCEAIALNANITGAIVVMEVQTGALRAVVSTPGFDPQNVAAALNQPGGPLLNRALSAFNVGSVFKPLVAAAALESGYSPYNVYSCVGYIEIDGHIYRCANSRAHGALDMQGALERSCNCYFINLANEIGAGALYGLCITCGFGNATPLAPGYYAEAGSLPTPQDLNNSGQLSTFSFGQGKLLATPLQIAASYNMLARGGSYIAPSLIAGYLLGGGAFNEETAPVTQRAVDENVASEILVYLASVVKNGLAKRAQPEFFTAAGKTGTAQTGRWNEDGTEIYDAWFAGFYPAENPKYTIVVCLENGGESGESAAPIFAQICNVMVEFGYVGEEDLQ